MLKYLFLIIYFSILSSSFAQTGVKIDSSERKQKQVLKDRLKSQQDSTDFLLFQGKHDKVILRSINNIKLAESIGDTAAAYYSRYIMGVTFMYLADYATAHEYAKDYTKFVQGVGDASKISQAYNFSGAIYVNEKKYDSGLVYFKKALPYSIKQKDTVETAMIYYNLSESYLNINQGDKARDYLKKSKDGMDSANYRGLTSEVDLLEGKINLFEKNTQAAVDNFESAIAYSTKQGNWDDNMIEVFKYYREALYENGDIEEAYFAAKKYDSLNSLQFEKEKVMAIQNAAAKFSANEYKKQAKQAELEKELISEKVKQSRILMYLFIGAALLMALFSLYIFQSSRKTKKLTLTLKEKNLQYLQAKEKSEKLALAKSKFFSTVSHELRTPLYGVIGLTSLLLDDKTLKTHEADLKNLKFSADYLLALINDVLQISKLESNTYDEIRAPFDIHEVIKGIVLSFEYILLQNKNKLHVQVSEKIPETLIGDRLRLSQILMNLLGNASKFTNNGDIFLSVNEKAITEDEITVAFSIRDTGIGIPRNKQKLIFEEFQQIESQDYKLHGTGLGLSIVKKLLDASNVKINLESEINQGTTISFDIIFQIEKHGIKENIARPEVVLEGKRILVVDDNRINQIVTKKILENQGVLCFIASSGFEAIEMITENNYDLVLMDINMPGKNGIETTREIRKFNSSLPIVALTAIEIDEMRERIKKSGMNDIIVKPYDVIKFLNIILKNLNQDSSPLEVKNISSN